VTRIYNPISIRVNKKRNNYDYYVYILALKSRYKTKDEKSAGHSDNFILGKNMILKLPME